jgi:hypothetical protein
METLQSIKRMMQTNKMAFDYNYTMMMGAYEHNKMLMYSILNSNMDVPEEAKDAIEKWLQTYRTGCEDLKRATDEGFNLVEKSLSEVKE